MTQRSRHKCSVPGCTRDHNSHGLCGMHGLRLARRGDVDNPGAFTYSPTGVCTVSGCIKRHLAKGLCGMHYQRSRSGRIDLPELLTCVRCGTEFRRPFKADPTAVRFCSHECRYATQLETARRRQIERYAYLKQWRHRNPDLFKAALLRRRATKHTADLALVTGKDLAHLARRYYGLCAYCYTSPYEHWDHVIPLARGGRHAIGNLLPACATCNLAKGSKLLSEWRLRQPLPRRFRLPQYVRSRQVLAASLSA